jgi:hypothetical protein
VRLANDWSDVPRSPEVVLYPVHEIAGEMLSTTGPVYEDLSREPATLFLREHDPTLTPEGVAAEVAQVLDTAGIDNDATRRAFAGGRPSRARIELRARIRVALTPSYEDNRSRDLIAQALGCSRQALHGLMAG